ncbi:hypothetical protein [Ruegeria aquimaris]|uniref:Orc1-like AAA ATPase domain-containing protein n=1 Tax=Ruegeria aquimaris TaxID=2984333 RepID=A0ABT3ANL9_9RHOB|nr:hypothetical protein [Ruegeria sp. XHP0148]MCV2890283.1 hypothetical protein [Ruegeria sp. XHP0148]
MQRALVDLAREVAAVSGCFAPDDLCRAVGLQHPSETRRDFLGQISRDIGEVTSPAPGAARRYGWILSPDQRRSTLRQFLTQTQLDQVLEHAPTPWQDDLFGQALHRLLAGDEVAITRPRTTDDDDSLLRHLRRNAALLDAVQFVRVVPMLDTKAMEDLETEVKRQIQDIQKRRDLANGQPTRHFGYRNVRRRLSNFLRGKTVDTRPVLLTGTGGIGKSALVARLLQDWQTRQDAPITVILDFDRPQLKSGSPIQIAREILNQLATGVRRAIEPAAEAEAMSRTLRDLRSRLLTTDTFGDLRDHVSQAAALETMFPEWFQGDWAAKLRDYPIALALDSFEAVDRQGGQVVIQILNVELWLRAHLAGLRTVLSGRAAPLSGEELNRRFGPASRRIELEGLSLEAGAKLLEQKDNSLSTKAAPPVLTDPALRLQVSELLDGHPLALQIFVSYARGHQGDIDGLVDSLKQDEGFRAEFAHRFLYERILERIDDPEMRKLAHPGLVLRQINDDLIRFVLAGPCLGLPDGTLPSEEQAARLGQKLKDEYWLVDEDEPPFALRHRADVRRMMVAGLFAGPRAGDTPQDRARKTELRRDALAVCAAARDYFLNGPPREAGAEPMERWAALDEALREVQALHYSAFVAPEDPPAFDAATARALDLSLGEDLETLPPAWRARVKIHLDRVLTREEAAHVPEDLREKAEAQEFTAAVQHGLSAAEEEFSTVSAASRKRAARGPKVEAHEDRYRAEGADWRSASRLSRDIQRTFAAARFDEVAELGAKYIEALGDQSLEEAEADNAEALTRGFWRQSLWQCLLVAGTNIDRSDMAISARNFVGSFDGYQSLVMAIHNFSADLTLGEMAFDYLRTASFRSYVDSYRLSESPLDDWLGRNSSLASLTGEPGSGSAAAPRSPRALALAAGRIGAEEEFASLFEAAPDLAGRIEKFWAQGAVGLSEIAALYRQFGEDEDIVKLLQSERLPHSDTAFRMFRGLNPDLYPPLRHILDDQEGEITVRLAQALSERARHWPRELRPEVVHGYTGRQSSNLIEAADQCGELGTLCAFLAEFDPRAATVHEMYDRLSDWFFPFARELQA